jgi:potassium efflux system protein
MDLTKAHPLVLRNPEPAVLFQGFSDTAMQFEVRAFVADVGTGGQVRNDLRFAVVDAFRREGIELAYTLRPPVAVVVEEKQQSGPVDAPPVEAKTKARPPRRRG